MEESQQPLPVLPVHADHDHRDTVKDPVCGMDVVPGAAAGSVEHDGRPYFFCSRHCVEKFRADPGRFLNSGAASASSVAAAGATKPVPAPTPGTTYTCPMHPEIVRDRPGSCPICGMALEPIDRVGGCRRRSRAGRHDPPVLDLPRAHHSAPRPLDGRDDSGLVVSRFLTGRGLVWIQLALAAPVVLWGGLPFFERGLGLDSPS